MQRNPEALGNCWLVDEIKSVDNANDEILSLNELNPARTAVVNTSEFKVSTIAADSNDRIEAVHLKPYNPNKLCYKSHTSGNRLAVFSEIYYEPDWFAYIDGKRVDYIRVNYILRGLEIPAGDHEIEFRNEAPLASTCGIVEWICSTLLVLLIAGALALYYHKKKKSAAAN